jgi:hypothetical protein
MLGGKNESLLFGCNKTFSVVLSTMIEAYYKFLLLDIGSYDRNTDGGIFVNWNSRKAIKNGNIGISYDRNPPRTHFLTP